MVLLRTFFENLHFLIHWTVTTFQTVTTVFINSCLEDRRMSLMRYKESIYTSHLEHIVIVRKQRSAWVRHIVEGKNTSFHQILFITQEVSLYGLHLV